MKIKKEEPQSQTENPILHLTDAAIKKIMSMMEKEGKEGYGLRVSVTTGGCAGLSYDLKFQNISYNNDVIIKQDELQIFVNLESISFLTGIEIDYVDTLKDSGFQYKNPNANSSCGCGTSFN